MAELGGCAFSLERATARGPPSARFHDGGISLPAAASLEVEAPPIWAASLVATGCLRFVNRLDFRIWGWTRTGSCKRSSARRAVCICGGEPAVTIGMLKRLRARTGRLGGGGRRCASSSGELSLAAPIGDREASSGEKDALAEPELWLREARRTLSVKSRCIALGEECSGVCSGEDTRRLWSSGVGMRQNCRACSAASSLCRSRVQMPGCLCQGMPRPRFLSSCGVILADSESSERERRVERRRARLPLTEAGLQLEEGREHRPHDDALPVDAFIPASQDISSELAAWARDSSSSSGLNSLLLAAPGDVGDRCAPRGWAACLQGAAASARRARTAHGPGEAGDMRPPGERGERRRSEPLPLELLAALLPALMADASRLARARSC
mmetsp:Transcript_79990/g.249360  ORF Transcript_79990/g.249360 Transcript_79990/m.249360 type:complete len:384 (-) Transcript_79990:13-1164(-)